MTNCNRKLKTQTFIKKQHSYTKKLKQCRAQTNKSTMRERKPTPMSKFQPKVIRDSNPDFRINLDPDVCRICLEMLQMHYLVGISHFACIVQIGVNCMIMSKNPLFCNGEENEKVIRNPNAGSYHHQKLITSKFGRRLFPHSLVILFTDGRND